MRSPVGTLVQHRVVVENNHFWNDSISPQHAVHRRTKKQGKKTRSDATHQDLEEGDGAIEEQQQKERSEKHKRIAANHHAAEHEQRNEAFVLPVDKAPEGIGDQCHRKGVRERTTQVEHQVKLTAAKPHKRMPRSGSILLHQCSAKSVEADEVQHSQHEAHYIERVVLREIQPLKQPNDWKTH